MLKQFSYQDLRNLRELTIYHGNEVQEDEHIIWFNGLLLANVHKISISNRNDSLFVRFVNDSGVIFASYQMENFMGLEINTNTGEYFVK